MTIFDWMWAAWITLFAVTESTALAIEYLQHRDGLTFSEVFWRVFHIRDRRPTPETWAMRALALIGLVWLTGHLAMGWWTL